MENTNLLALLAVLFSTKLCLDAVKVDINPPGSFLVDITVEYLKIRDVVLSVFENTSVPVAEYANMFNHRNVLCSVYVWTNTKNIEQQFRNFIKVVSGGTQKTVNIFLDEGSTEIFLQQAHLVKDKLVHPCFYRWVFFDFASFDVFRLQVFNTSTVCWSTVYVTKTDGKEQPFFVKIGEGLYDYEGMEFELLKTLRTKLNFQVKFVKNVDGQFGKKLNNGSWTGFIRLINTGKIIFSISTLSISNERLEAVDFSSPYMFGKLAFVVISPTLESRRFVLIKPLQPDVWIALVGTLLFCTLILYLITHSLPCKSGVRRSYNIWFLLRTLGQQGTPSPAPARYSIRFFISGWWFFIMVILWSYAGTLTSFMTYPGFRPAIDTIDKLQHALSSGSIQYGTLKGTFYERFLTYDMAKDNPIFGQILIDNPDFLVENMMEGLERVLQGKYVFVYMKSILKWFAATLGFNRFQFSKNVFSTDVNGIACQKCHPCKKSFDHIVDRLEETGFISKWYDDIFTKASIKAPQINVNLVRSLSVDDVQGAFYFLGICHLLSISVLLCEVIISSILSLKRKSKRRKTRKHK